MADPTLSPIVQRMIDAGESEENIATVIQHFKANAPQSASGVVSPNESSDVGWTGLKDLGKAFAPAKVGHDIMEAGRGAVHGALSLVNPATYWTGEKANIAEKQRLEAAVKADPNHFPTDADTRPLGDRISSALEPLTTARGIGETTGNIMGGMVLGKVAPPILEAAQNGVVRVATSPVTRNIAAGVVKHGSTAAGAYVGGVPGAIAGSTLGEEMASSIRAPKTPVPDARALKIAQLEDNFDSAMAKRNVSFYDEQQAAKATAAKDAAKTAAEARKSATIEAARKGMDEGSPSFSETVTAQTPEGTRQSMTTRYTAPEEAASVGSGPSNGGGGGISPAERAALLKQGLTNDVIDRMSKMPSQSTPNAKPFSPTANKAIKVLGPVADATPPVEIGQPAVAARPYTSPEYDAELGRMMRVEPTPNGRAVFDQMSESGQLGPESQGFTRRKLAAEAAAKATPDPMEQQLAAMEQGQPSFTHEAGAVDTPGLTVGEMPGPNGPPSDMEAALLGREAKLPVEGNVPGSKSRRGPMSATPGLTVADAEALGINPNMRITGLTPEAIQKLLSDRATRAAGHFKGAQRGTPDMQWFQ